MEGKYHLLSEIDMAKLYDAFVLLACFHLFVGLPGI